eukprot:gnl/TRDRNA2_/TRDRNA2_94065_c0_seq1.p1 gnl/TRDRNA2_/TRDRNA2_94065_c0~~gnl/TRDRNA2_/TRDRNA2_94065_c0_seq1.p1  ORF type:complete len:590 (+),score=112.45 gnl/TRDRNA2_/TRDRNA2_94065_c0_seq1:67-1770(+)
MATVEGESGGQGSDTFAVNHNGHNGHHGFNVFEYMDGEVVPLKNIISIVQKTVNDAQETAAQHEHNNVTSLYQSRFASPQDLIAAKIVEDSLKDGGTPLSAVDANRLLLGGDFMQKYVEYEKSTGRASVHEADCDTKGHLAPSRSRFTIVAVATQAAQKSIGRIREGMIRIMDHRYFNYVISMMVVANAVFIGLDEEYRARVRLKLIDDSDMSLLHVLEASEHIFTVLFCVETSFRFFALGFSFFFSSHSPWWCPLHPWNLLDLCLAVNSILASSGASRRSADALRVLRLGRLLWFLHLFKELWIIVVGIMSAMRTVCWAFLLLFLIIYVFGLVITRYLGQQHLSDPEVYELFGDLWKSMFTLFTMVTDEGWAFVVRTVHERNSLFSFLLVIFFMVTNWGIMNVVIAVVIEATVGKALHHMENYVKIAAEERQQAIVNICEVFWVTNPDGTGHLTKAKFLQALEDEDVVRRLHEVGIDVRQADSLFDLLDFDRSGELDVYEFTEGVLEARGPAEAMDVLRMKYDLQRFHDKVKNDIRAAHQGIQDMTNSSLKEAQKVSSTLSSISRT